MNRFQLRRMCGAFAVSALLLPGAAQAQTVQPDPPYLTQSGWILARGTGFATDGRSRVFITAQIHGAGGTVYGGSMPGDSFGLARAQGSVRCPKGRGTYYTQACVWQQLPSGHWARPICGNSPNQLILCG
jgi:hypothetical protein